MLPDLMIEINQERSSLNESSKKEKGDKIDYNPFFLFLSLHPFVISLSIVITSIFIFYQQRISTSFILGVIALIAMTVFQWFWEKVLKPFVLSKIDIPNLFNKIRSYFPKKMETILYDCPKHKKNFIKLAVKVVSVAILVVALSKSGRLLDIRAYIDQVFEIIGKENNSARGITNVFEISTFSICLFSNLTLNSNSNYIKSYWTSLFILLDGLTTYYLITTIPTLAKIGRTGEIWSNNIYLALFLIVLGILQMFVTYSKLAEREVNKQYIITLKGLDSQEELK